MGVYIKGMEMPTRCAVCWLMDGEDSWCCACRGKHLASEFRYGIKDRPDWCPLIEVPPHGRLGDLDRLAKEVEDMAKEFPLDSIGAERYRLFADFIKTAPTVIPAEEDTND